MQIIFLTVLTKSNFKLLLDHKMEDHQEDDKKYIFFKKGDMYETVVIQIQICWLQNFLSP